MKSNVLEVLLERSVSYVPLWKTKDGALAAGFSYDTPQECVEFFEKRNKAGFDDQWQAVEERTRQVVDVLKGGSL